MCSNLKEQSHVYGERSRQCWVYGVDSEMSTREGRMGNVVESAIGSRKRGKKEKS